MTFEELLRIVWRRKWIVIVTTLVATLATYVVSSSLPKVYSADSALIVKAEGTTNTVAEATQVASVLSKTYAELIQRRSVAEEVAARLGEEDPDELLSKMSFQPVSDTRLLLVTAEGDSPEGAADLANTYGDVFEEIVDERIGETTAGTVAVADEALPPESADRPRPTLYSAGVFVISLFLGIGLAVLRDRLETRLRTDELGPALDLPVLARIPVTRVDKHRLLEPSTRGTFLEACRVLRANLEFIESQRRPTSLLVTSPGPGEGKTACSAGLARVIAEQGRRVVLIEGDMREPSLGGEEGPVATRGLADLLAFDLPFEEVIEETASENLYLLPAGPLPDNPANLLTPTALERLIAEVSAWSDFVVVDSPPVVAGPDAMLLGRAVSGSVLVVSSRRTERANALAAVDALRRARANLLGVVINEVPESAAPHGTYGRDLAARPRRLTGARGASRRGSA